MSKTLGDFFSEETALLKEQYGLTATTKEKKVVEVDSKKKKLAISDETLNLVNRVKDVLHRLDDQGIESITFFQIGALNDANRKVVKLFNLKYQKHLCKGQDDAKIPAYYEDMVRPEEENACD